jgi:hypothetical protein
MTAQNSECREAYRIDPVTQALIQLHELIRLETNIEPPFPLEV